VKDENKFSVLIQTEKKRCRHGRDKAKEETVKEEDKKKNYFLLNFSPLTFEMDTSVYSMEAW
jgi:hypothetical protein